MNKPRPVFSAQWPLYAVAAHLVFWAASGCLLFGLTLSICTSLGSAQANIYLFVFFMVACFLLGVSAIFSGLIYRGNQVFAREPTTGWRAHVAGSAIALSSGGLMLFAYALTTIRGG